MYEHKYEEKEKYNKWKSHNVMHEQLTIVCTSDTENQQGITAKLFSCKWSFRIVTLSR